MNSRELKEIRAELADQMRCMASFLLTMADFVKAAGHIMTQDELDDFSCCVAEVRGKRLFLNMLETMEAR